MKSKSLLETIDFANHQFSLLLVDPKPNMLEWLSTFQKERGLEKYKLYYPEGNLVVIVPNIDRFSVVVVGAFERFIDDLKPRLLQAELTRFGATPQDFGRPITKETLEEFYDLSVRESAMLLSDFKGAESLCTILA